MAGGSDDMSCMFLGGGKGDMIDLWCRGLDYDDSQMAAKIHAAVSSVSFWLLFGRILDRRTDVIQRKIGWLIFGG